MSSDEDLTHAHGSVGTLEQVRHDGYRREHWRSWYLKDVLHMAYWPKYVESQRDWVNSSVDDLVRDLVAGGIKVMNWGGPENWFPVTAGLFERHPALESGNDFYGVIYAPTSPVTIDGSADLFGAVVGKTLTLTGSGRAHYDESLHMEEVEFPLRTTLVD